ncbi:MAG: ABC transporter permease [Bacteroidota bacterium]
MIRYFLKGLIRDRQRSLLPVIVVTIGVMMAVLLQTWVTGVFGDMVDFNAKFTTGHVKIMSRAYAENRDQMPIDLALTGTGELKQELSGRWPDVTWVERIQFGGLIDVPDSLGETRAQGPAVGMAVDLLSPGTKEIDRLNLVRSLVRGALPSRPGEILISEDLSQKINAGPGQTVSLITSTMYGSMSVSNYTVSGTIRYGVTILDRGGIVLDLADARFALDMDDAAGEILGYLPSGEYDEVEADSITAQFNRSYYGDADNFAPEMLTLSEQNDLGAMIEIVNNFGSLIILIFLIALSVVLWNAGLLGGLRRYGEIGLRIAIGEDKGHVYRSMIYESVLIGIAGSIIGTAIGLGLAAILSKGIDLGTMLQNSSMMMQSVFRTRITPTSWYIGFIPGLLSTILGTMLSGVGIYKRQTASLFKELQA